MSVNQKKPVGYDWLARVFVIEILIYLPTVCLFHMFYFL